MVHFFSTVTVMLLLAIGRAAILTTEQHILGTNRPVSTPKGLEKIREEYVLDPAR